MLFDKWYPDDARSKNVICNQNHDRRTMDSCLVTRSNYILAPLLRTLKSPPSGPPYFLFLPLLLSLSPPPCGWPVLESAFSFFPELSRPSGLLLNFVSMISSAKFSAHIRCKSLQVVHNACKATLELCPSTSISPTGGMCEPSPLV
jgi:hypothetical protein